jgi:hypothetical protein
MPQAAADRCTQIADALLRGTELVPPFRGHAHNDHAGRLVGWGAIGSGGCGGVVGVAFFHFGER